MSQKTILTIPPYVRYREPREGASYFRFEVARRLRRVDRTLAGSLPHDSPLPLSGDTAPAATFDHEV